MRARPREDFGNLSPVADLLVLQLLDRSTRNNHAVVLLIAHLLEVTIEHHHVLDGRILGRMTLQLHEAHLQLQRGVRQETDKVCLCRYLQRHEVENDNLQRTDVLHVGTRIVHHEDILMLQQFYGRQTVW